MKSFSDSRRIILSRALTNSGDQAWDFAVPVCLALQFPDRLDLVALIFFVSRLGHVILLPLLGPLIDRVSRVESLKFGLGSQFFGVIFQMLGLLSVASAQELAFTEIVLGGILTGLGSAMINIVVAQDLVPSLFAGDHLTQINSRVRQLDLFSEVLSPVLAGLLLLVSIPDAPLLGLALIAIWNLVSFVPEYFLLRSVLRNRAAELQKPSTLIIQQPIWEKLSGGWKQLVKLSIAPAVFAYTLLWLSALSPHGVLLTAYLKDSWKLPELTLGAFRGLGAIFGLAATLVFPWLLKRVGLIRACRFSIIFQALMLLVALVAFEFQYAWVFLTFVLLSRVGLYSFSLGEQQIRQIGIPQNLRGSVNATASALTSLATLALLGLGSLLGAANEFSRLVEISVGFVVLAAILFYAKVRTTQKGLIDDSR
jgi:iron-regulated transporter 1